MSYTKESHMIQIKFPILTSGYRIERCVSSEHAEHLYSEKDKH